MPKKTEGPCVVDGCEDQIHAKGYCTKHYRRLRTYGRTDRIRERNIGRTCEFDGCLEPAVKRGYCDVHRKFLRRNDPRTATKRKYESLWHDRKSKGILCEEWTDFDQFCAGIGERPSLSHSLMRKDERQLYGPENFQWVQENPRRKLPPKVNEWNAPSVIARRTKDCDRDKYGRYGITAAEYEKMHDRQDGKCAICELPETRLESRTGNVMKLVVDHCHDTLKVRALLCWRCNIGLGVAKDSVKVLQKMIAYLERHNEPKEQAA